MDAFYDPMRSYEANYAEGPFGDFAAPGPARSHSATTPLLGVEIARPFGIPAGPLLHRAFTRAAFDWGYSLVTYKTVRTRAHASHAWPNTMAVHVDGPLDATAEAVEVLADLDFSDVRSITNSFGVPSQDPDVWQPDMAAAVADAGHGQALIASFQGTGGVGGEDAYIADHVACARLVAQTGARIAELNLSCPNEGIANLLCFDTPRVARIVAAVREELGDTALLLKLAYFSEDAALAAFIDATHALVDGYAAINTIPARPVNAHGAQALPGAGREISGVCGEAIFPAARAMVERLAAHRDRIGGGFAIVGVGGVRSADDYLSMRHAGADAVLSATGAMWDPRLALRVEALPAGS